MAGKPSILAFSGSLRKESFNQRLVKIAAHAAQQAGADVEVISLADYPLPIFDEDLEAKEGLPENAKKLKALFKRHQGLLISSPEYNSSVTAALKNTIDWVSRPLSDSKPLEAFAGKVAGLMGASPGTLGGLRGLVHLRAILGNIQVLVLPDQFALNHAHEAFDAAGQLKDAAKQQAVEGIGKRVVSVAGKLMA